MTAGRLIPPFPWFGGKRDVADLVWQRLGEPKHYIEPFCGGAAVLLAAPRPAALEVIGDSNGFVANFWRATKYQPDEVAFEADYPVSHIDLTGRHAWLLDQRARLSDGLRDPTWPGDARVAGWWMWGQCAWIGAGWCDWEASSNKVNDAIPVLGCAGRGIQAVSGGTYGKRLSQAGLNGLTAAVGGEDSDAARSVFAGHAHTWVNRLSSRLTRVRAIHGDWQRCMNTHYGTHNQGVLAIFFDPPYRGFEALYDSTATDTATAVAEWCREHPELRIALCGHVGDYDLPGWDVVRWQRTRPGQHGSKKTRDQEAIWFSPACLSARQQPLLF